jgi:hypothetical protein
MSGFSPKVTAATVAASAASVVGGIVGPYVFPDGTPADVKGLWLAGVTAAVTFASGYLTRHVAVAKEAEHVVSVAEQIGKPFSQVAQLIDFAQAEPAPVAPVAPVETAPAAPAAPLLYPPQ